MASVTRFRCPVTPDECPTSSSRGFCPTHEWERLVPQRLFLREEVAAEPTDESASEPRDEPAVEPRDEPDGEPEGEAPQRAGAREAGSGRYATAGSGYVEAEGGRVEAGGARRSAGTAAVRPAPVRLALVLAGVLVPLRGEGEAPTRLGRDAPDCAHVTGLDRLDQISREHAELYWESGRLYIRDTCSSNGTFVDGERIEGPARVWPGRHPVRLAQDVDLAVVELDEFGAPL